MTAFGSTRRAGVAPEEDATLNTLLRAETDSVCIFGKSWTLHVVEILKTTLEENLQLIEDSVAYLVAHGREVIYDAEHFFDGYKADADYAVETLLAAERGGARILVLCDTNGGTLTSEMGQIVEQVKPSGLRCPLASTRTTMLAWAWPIRSWPWSGARCKCKELLTAMASAAAMPTCAPFCPTWS